MSDKLPNMPAQAAKPKRPMGRPPKFHGGVKTRQVLIPLDLEKAVEKHNEEHQLGGYPDALRALLREAAEARKLIPPRR